MREHLLVTRVHLSSLSNFLFNFYFPKKLENDMWKKLLFVLPVIVLDLDLRCMSISNQAS